MANCRKLISDDLDVACKPFGARYATEAIIVNRSDVALDNSALPTDLTGKLTTLPMSSTYSCYRARQLGNTPFNGTQIAANVGKYYNTFTRTLSLLFSDTDADDGFGANAKALLNARLVVFLRIADTDVYEIYGLENPLHLTELTRNPYDEDAKGAWVATFEETDCVGMPWCDGTLMATITHGGTPPSNG